MKASYNAAEDPFINGAFMFLEAEEWESAADYFQQVLDHNPSAAIAYLGKLMAELHIKKKEDIVKSSSALSDSINFQNAVRLADEEFKKELVEYDAAVRYNIAVKTMEEAQEEQAYLNAAIEFRALNGYRNAVDLAKECEKRGMTTKYESIYNQAAEAYNKGKATSDYKEKKKFLEKALCLFKQIPGWKDANKKAKECNNLMQEHITNEQDDTRGNQSINVIEDALPEHQGKTTKTEEKNRKRVTGLCITAVLVIGCLIAIIMFFKPDKYNQVADELQTSANMLTTENHIHNNQSRTASPTYQSFVLPSSKPSTTATPVSTKKTVKDIDPMVDAFCLKSAKDGFYIGLGKTKPYNEKTGYYLLMTPEEKNAIVFSNGAVKNGAIRLQVNNTVASGYYLDAWNPKKTGYGVDIWPAGQDSDQFWALDKQKDGSYLVYLPAFPDMCLTYSPSIDPKWQDVLSLQPRDYNNADSQRWYLNGVS